MPSPTKGARLGGSPAHERLLLANLATALFEHGRITTTAAKARRLRPYAERLITKAKRGDLHNRREVMRVIRDKDVVHKLFAEIGPFFADRDGGYTRIVKTMPRKGDNAPMAVIELIPQKTATAEAERARRTRFARRKDAAATAPVATEEKAADEDTTGKVADDAGADATEESQAESAGATSQAEGDDDATAGDAGAESAAETGADTGADTATAAKPDAEDKA